MKNDFNLKLIMLIASAILLGCSANKSSYSKKAYLLHNVNIVDVENGGIQKGTAIIIDNGIIKAIGKLNVLKELVNKENHYDLKNKYLIPGLWDMHSHIDKLSGDFEHSKSMLSLYTLNGVTSIREMGGDWSKIKKLKQATKNNEILPAVYTAGPILENKAFVDWVAKIDNDPEFKKNRVRIAHESEVERIIDSVKSLGVDFLKIRTAASKEVFFEIARQAKAKDLKFAGHVDAKVDLYNAVKSGISSLEHLDIFQLSGMSDSKMDSIVFLMKELKTGYCPTLTYFKNHRIYDKIKIKSFLNDSTYSRFPNRAYVSNRLLQKSSLAIKRAEESQAPWKKMEANFLKFAKKLVKNNILILAGTDGANALVLPGFSLHKEMELYNTELGMTPLQILQSATINPSKYFNVQETQGQIKESYVANLVVLNSNPLEKISNIRDIDAVINLGVVISNEDRKNKLNQIRSFNINQ